MREDKLQMSRQEFARLVVRTGQNMGEVVACTVRLVAAWEDGEVQMPRAVYRRILTQLTGCTMTELGFRPSTPPARAVAAATAPRGEDQVNCRGFLADSAGAALSLIPLPPPRDNTPGRIGSTNIRTVDKAVAAIYGHDHDHGSAAMRRAAAEALHTAYWWLQDGTYTLKTGRRLRSATGHLSIAVGWLSYDSGRAADARSLYNEALAAARIADDAGLEAHAFGCLSLLAKASGRPREAISDAQGAQSVAGSYGSPRTLSLFAMREAGGWALLGDVSAADRAIVRAHQLYAKGPRKADPDWLEFYTPAELAGLEALARADLDQHEGAVAGAEQAVLLHGDRFARNRALYTADVAIQHAIRERRSRKPRPRPPDASSHTCPTCTRTGCCSSCTTCRARYSGTPPSLRSRTGWGSTAPSLTSTKEDQTVTTPTTTDVVIRTYGPGQVPPLVDTLADIWADSHPELVDNPGAEILGLSVPALRRQITGHLKHPGFVLVVAYASGNALGFGYAFPCKAAYWFGALVDQVPDAARHERLMGLCELAVRPPWQSHGIGSRLHAALLQAVNPSWSSLLALPSNQRGQDLYARLGYRYAGPYRNTPEGPEFDLLLMQVQGSV
ncbi:GNAT family N-acetyltransferase [Streptomyces sp. MN13]